MSTQVPTAAEHSRRWFILGVVVLAQMMVILDATILNIALPSAQRALAFSDGDRQWIVTAYALAFGSLLPLAGRIGDFFGRRRALVVGAIGFAAVSAFGGLAQSFEWLLVARAVQGMFGALLAPAALALLSTTFTDSRERNRAFGIFGAVVGSGAAIGLLLGGVLTEYLSWRWTLYVNVVLAVPVALGALALLTRRALPRRPHLDLPGALTSAAGLFLIVFGFSEAERAGWSAGLTIGSLVAGVVLLAVFAAVESRSRDALLPLRVLADRNRAGAYLAVLIAGTGIFGVFLFVTYYMQQNLGFSPVVSGLAFLPMVAAIMLSATGSNILLLSRFGPRPLVATGMTLAALGIVVLTRLDLGSTYAANVLPALLVTGFGMGLIFAPATNLATAGVQPADSGIASALVNIGQQIGGSIGTALLNTIAVSATSAYLSSHGGGPSAAAAATVHGYTVAFWWSATIFAVGAVVCGALLTGAGRRRPSREEAAGRRMTSEAVTAVRPAPTSSDE